MHNYFRGTEALVVAEEDIRRLFVLEHKSNLLQGKTLSKTINLVYTLALLFAVGFGVLNAPALYTKAKYAFQRNLIRSEVSNAPAVMPSLPTPTTGQAVTMVEDPAPEVTTPAVTDKPNNRLYINSIKVDAPINWDVADDNDTVMKSLESGVSGLRGNAKPGQRGTIFVVGHSSNFIFAKGDYKHVFAVLTEVQKGDIITITYNQTEYQYRVTETSIVGAKDVNVRDNATDESILKLMTCYPVGSNAKRFIVTAKPINHTQLSPLTNPTTGGNTLPGVR